MLDLETLWQYIRDKFEAEFSPIAFTTWIASAQPLQLTDNTLVVEVASKLHQDYWKQNIIPQITSLLADNLSLVEIFRLYDRGLIDRKSTRLNSSHAT